MKVVVVLGLAGFLAASCANPNRPSCSYAVTPLVFTPCMNSSQGTVTVSTQSGCSWSVTRTAQWLTINNGQVAGTGAGTFGFTVAENFAAPRSATIDVRSSDAAANVSVQIDQAGCLYSVIPESKTVPATGADGSFDVLQMAQPNVCGGPTQDRCVWTAVSGDPWITVLSSMGVGDGRVSFRVAANDGPSSRTGTITVRDKVFQITQMGH